MPTMTNTDLKTLLGQDTALAQSISREELCRRQDLDKDIRLLKEFISTSMPSLTAFHRLYPSERAKYLFSRRKLLSLSPDNILLIARTPGAHTLDHRIVLPHCLIYRALLLSHCIGTELHRSVVATYNELKYRCHLRGSLPRTFRSAKIVPCECKIRNCQLAVMMLLGCLECQLSTVRNRAESLALGS